MLTTPGPIAVVAPSHKFDEQRLAAGLQLAREAGLELAVFPELQHPHRYFANTDEVRARHLREALTAEGYSAVWMVRGGSGMARLVDGLVDAPVRRDRPVIGFSDVTALFCTLHRLGAGPLLHAPVLHSLPSTDEGDRLALWAALRGEPGALPGVSWVGGSAEGWLCGGNIVVLATMCGTRWQLNAHGAILVLEDVGELPFRLDRALQQLRSAGVFDGVRGVVVGDMVDCHPPEEEGYTLRDVFLEHLEPLGVPVLAEVPVGHGARNRPFPWGALASLTDGSLRWRSSAPGASDVPGSA